MITGIHRWKDRPITKYLELARTFLDSPHPKIVFADLRVINEFKLTCKTATNTLILPVDKEDMYLYRYMDQMSRFSPNTVNPDKDTLEYVMLQCCKTEYVRRAIDLNPFKTTQFMWVDFGIRHMFSCSDGEFADKLAKICQK
jgi:hypothetical protein